jgi:hypothetical protein
VPVGEARERCMAVVEQLSVASCAELENRSLTFFLTGTETDTDTGLTTGNRSSLANVGLSPYLLFLTLKLALTLSNN